MENPDGIFINSKGSLALASVMAGMELSSAETEDVVSFEELLQQSIATAAKTENTNFDFNIRSNLNEI